MPIWGSLMVRWCISWWIQTHTEMQTYTLFPANELSRLVYLWVQNTNYRFLWLKQINNRPAQTYKASVQHCKNCAFGVNNEQTYNVYLFSKMSSAVQVFWPKRFNWIGRQGTLSAPTFLSPKLSLFVCLQCTAFLKTFSSDWKDFRQLKLNFQFNKKKYIMSALKINYITRFLHFLWC